MQSVLSRVGSLVYVCLLVSLLAQSQTPSSFEGIDAIQVSRPEFDVDPNGAIGTKQFMEWTNVAYQAYDKTTFNPVWASPLPGATPWTTNGVTDCPSMAGDGVIIFDRLASLWVIAAHSSPGISGPYYYCVAVSTTDDLTSPSFRWRAYKFALDSALGTNSNGHPYFPDWPRLASWSNAYYAAFDLLDPDNHYIPVGVVVCALDRTNMLTGATLRTMQCFSDPLNPHGTARYLRHSLNPADVEGTTAPPAGRDEFLVSIQNPPLNHTTITSTVINLWDFHLDWSTPANSRLTSSTLQVSSYEPGCYNLTGVGNTYCVPEPAVNGSGVHFHVDSVGDRIMPRLSYRNFQTYESFVFSHTIRVGVNSSQRTGIRWYELRGSGVPTVFQSGVINPDSSLFRFMPSIAQDKVGNAAIGYSVSSSTVHPGIRASWWNLPGKTKPTEIILASGSADEENAQNWGDYTSMSVDPVDGCTFWFVDQYFNANQTGNQINWNTRISNFKLSNCQ
jgi:hypothetical protein